MLASETMGKVDEIIQFHGSAQSSVITILQEIQKEYSYLPVDILEYVSEEMDISPAKLFGIATFYGNFSLEPKGKHIIKICDGTACHIRKSMPILEAIKEELKLTEDKHTTDDMLFTVEIVSCLGACGLAPIVNVDGKVYSKMTPEKTVELLNLLKEDN